MNDIYVGLPMEVRGGTRFLGAGVIHTVVSHLTWVTGTDGQEALLNTEPSLHPHVFTV